jgi:hypothetical protein
MAREISVKYKIFKIISFVIKMLFREKLIFFASFLLAPWLYCQIV